MLTPRQFEAAAERLAQDMNRKYFQGGARVIGIKLAKFDKRTTSRVVLGMYDTGTQIIYLNYHMRYVLAVNPSFTRAYMSVVWHELVHAMITTALMPSRLGLYIVADDHGAEFQTLYAKRKFNASDEEMEKLFQVVISRQRLLQSE